MRTLVSLLLYAVFCTTLSALFPVPADDDEPFQFLVIGDWGRNGQENQQDVADQMGQYARKHEPEFVINVGDNFYPNGVASIDDPQWMSSFEQIYKDHSLMVDWWSILGNHDYHGSPQAQIDYSKKSRRWRMPARYYTFAQNGIRFVFLDTNPFLKKYITEAHEYADVAKQDTQKQLLWLDNVLKTSKEPWKIVIGHHPVYSAGKHGDTPELIARLKPILEKHKVQAYFCGHDHDLQHHTPADSKVHYFISGAGSEVREIRTMRDFTRFAADQPGFAAVSMTKDSLVVKFVNAKGQELYRTARGK